MEKTDQNIYTLVELGTEINKKSIGYVVGTGSDINDTNTLLNSAKKSL